ncbi:MAG: GDSL-type esterase/lipase family protein [Firmicutes bacterium]|nr:GDSL-type esterase/lipase family protein [Bacillota bacterium]
MKFKRTVAIFIFIIALMLVPFLSVAYGKKITAEHGTHSIGEPTPFKPFVVLGDSIANGYGVTSSQAYASIVANEKGYELNKSGAVDGLTTSGLINLLQNNSGVQTAVENANIINVSIGGNDFLQSNPIEMASIYITWQLLGETAGKTEMDTLILQSFERFKQIIANIKSSNNTAPITVLKNYAPWMYGYGSTPIPEVQTILDQMGFPYNLITVTGTSMHPITNYAAVKFGQLMEQHLVVNPDSYIITDIYSVMNSGAHFNSADWIHPSAVGHLAIANALIATIEQLGDWAPITPPEQPCSECGEEPCICDGNQDGGGDTDGGDTGGGNGGGNTGGEEVCDKCGEEPCVCRNNGGAFKDIYLYIIFGGLILCVSGVAFVRAKVTQNYDVK